MKKQLQPSIKEKESRLNKLKLERLSNPSLKIDEEIAKLEKEIDYFYYGIQ